MKTHCNRGHEFTPENTRLTYSNNGRRKCILCIKFINSLRNKKDGYYEKSREYDKKRRAKNKLKLIITNQC
jgi:hypothetical protein